jgi:uncharacterized protein YdaU (DUF1376 family)
MPFYVADHLADTPHLTTEQQGAYLLILMAMWRQGGVLPADDATLARIARSGTAKWLKTKSVIMPMFQQDGGQITQKRLAAELEKAGEKSQKRSHAGKSGAAAKALKKKKAAQANASANGKHFPEPEPESKRKKQEAPPNGADSLGLELTFPTWWPGEEWAAFVQLRQKLKKPLTDFAIGLMVKDVTAWKAKGQDPAAIFQQSLRKSWQDVYELKGLAAGPGAVTAAPSETDAPLDLWVWRLETFHHGRHDDDDDLPVGYWQVYWGPQPSEPGCLAPEEAWRLYVRQHGVGAVRHG